MSSSIDLVVGKHYKLTKKLGEGSFGQIFKALHQETGEEYAVKLEQRKTKCPQLIDEAKKYLYFLKNSTQEESGIANVYYCAKEGNYNILIMDLLGPSLEQLFQYCSKKFSLKTMLMIAIQVIDRIEFLHSKNYMHRDIKPDNFVLGGKKFPNKIFIIDFGLSKPYQDKHGIHIAYIEGKDLVGTARYASIKTHEGCEQGRRDDLVSIGYMFLYFLLGELP